MPGKGGRASGGRPDFEDGLGRTADGEDVLGREDVRGVGEHVGFDGTGDVDSSRRAGGDGVGWEGNVE